MRQKDVSQMGNLLYASHQGLSDDYEVSCEDLDFLVGFSKDTKGVVGARMMGRGLWCL